MIELFDAQRLLPRRDRSLQLAGGAMALGLLGLGLHGYTLHRDFNVLQAEGQAQQAELKKLKAAAPPPTPTLLADMEQLARRLESEVAAATGGTGAAAPSPSQWLDRLDALGTPDVGLNRIEIDRAGSARIEGVAKSPQAMSGYVQAWERDNAPAPMRARAIEVRQDDKAGPLLRFQMRANLPGPVVQ